MESITALASCQRCDHWNNYVLTSVIEEKVSLARMSPWSKGASAVRKNFGRPFIVLLTVLSLSLLFILVTGCGQIAGGVSGLSACTGGATSFSLKVPTALYVTRTSTNEQWAPPLDRCVTDAAAVQRLYVAAYALPLPPGRKLVSCPAGPDLVYNITFLHGTKQVQQIALQMTSCQFLHIGKTDGRDITPSFLSLFAQTSGISPLVPNP